MCAMNGIRAVSLLLVAVAAASATPAAPCQRGTCSPVGEHVLMQRPRLVMSKALAPRAGDSEAESVVERYGALRAEGNKIVGNKTGMPVRLRGMSLFWSHWKPQFWTHDTVRWLKEDWNVTLVRAAMGVEYGGYLENPEVERARLEAVVDAAVLEGLYVIIDWHDHLADEHLEQSVAFFRDMARKYGQLPNVLFEVFNEPMKQPWDTVIKPYHERLVSVIREHSDNLIILGTRLWSQEVDEASRNPVAGDNLAYTIHFYASSHGEWLREKVKEALSNRVAIFATEWGTCDATGDGTLDLGETRSWLDFFEKHHISDANWAIGDKMEACSALKPGARGTGGWAPCELTASGAYVRASLRGERTPPPGAETLRCPWQPEPPAGPCAEAGDDCAEMGCCQDASLRCFQKNEWWASCKASCAPGLDPSDPPEHRTPWTCKLLG